MRQFLAAIFLLAQPGHLPAFELPERPDPVCERFTTGEWWKEKNHILKTKVERDQVIAFGIYFQAAGTLKLTAQLYPLYPTETLEVRLEFKEGETWKQAAKQDITPLGWNTTFLIDDWDSSRNIPYRLLHGERASYEGVIRSEPADGDPVSIAAFSCDSSKSKDDRTSYIANINHQDPDLIFWAGDQSYYHKEHTSGWLLWGRHFRELFRTRPCITIPDDHDVGQGNLWGEGGKQSTMEGGPDGGYTHTPEYINLVQRTQCGHLPDPFDPTPIERGIGVYYTSFTYGGVSFAVLEDRKFKSGPAGKVNPGAKRPDYIEHQNYDPAKLDPPGLTLLGKRQLAFLEKFAQSSPGTMKVVLSQAPFAGPAHLFGRGKVRRYADLDSNGWPQTGRNAALRAIRNANAIHICGDQHLGTLLQHGIDTFRDGPWAFAVPASANTYYGRFWWPEDEKPGMHPDPKNPLPWNGDYLDGFENKITMHAYANPNDTQKGDGYGLIRLNKKKREVTFECWPRESDIASGKAKQFTGWPKTVKMRPLPTAAE